MRFSNKNIIIIFISAASLLTLAVKRKAEVDGGTKKITEFFNRDRQPKKAKTADVSSRGPRCPAMNCNGEMKEKTSQSASNPNRPYQKCDICETFRWRGSLNFCDKYGVWTFLEPRNQPSESDIQLEEMNRGLRINQNIKFLADLQKWKQNGEWEGFDEKIQKRLNEMESYIQRDISW